MCSISHWQKSLNTYEPTTYESKGLLPTLGRATNIRSKAPLLNGLPFNQVDDLVTGQSVTLDKTFPKLSDEIIVRGLWLCAAQSTKYLPNSLLQSQSGKILDNNVPLLPSQQPTFY